MKQILIRKALLSVLYLFIVSFVAFFLSQNMPGDPAKIIANLHRDQEAPEYVVERVRQQYGFDRGWGEQYWSWLNRVRQGDLGYSVRTHLPVTLEIQQRLPITLKLAMATFLVTICISFPLGIYAGVTANRFADLSIQALSWVGYSFPVFLLGNILIWLFSVRLSLLPALGHETALHFILPVTALSLQLSGWLTHVIRASVKEMGSRHFVLVAKAKGLPRHRIVWLYLLRPALLPVVTALLMQLGDLVSGSLIVETVFAWNGLGRLLIESILARDFTVIQGIVLYFGAVFAVLNVLIDFLYLSLDPSTARHLSGVQ